VIALGSTDCRVKGDTPEQDLSTGHETINTELQPIPRRFAAVYIEL
jgi:hypothetical protein